MIVLDVRSCFSDEETEESLDKMEVLRELDLVCFLLCLRYLLAPTVHPSVLNHRLSSVSCGNSPPAAGSDWVVHKAGGGLDGHMCENTKTT